MKTSAFTALALSLALSSVSAQTVPPFINYQGLVTDSGGLGLGAGTPVNRRIIFRIFDAPVGGARLWSEQQTVTIANGEFSVLLGNGIDAVVSAVTETPRPALDTVFATGTSTRFLEILVDNGDGTFNGSDAAITPRQQITSTAYSFRARSADTIAAGTDLQLNSSANYGLGYYGGSRLFNGLPVDGPVLYGNSGGALGANVNGTQSVALRWNAAGNVGVGLPSPTSKFHVLGDVNFQGVNSSFQFIDAPVVGGVTVGAQLTTGTANAAQLRFRRTADAIEIGQNSSGSFVVENGSDATLLNVTQTGRVGVNTGATAPAAFLQVNGDNATTALSVRVAGVSKLEVGVNGGVSIAANAGTAAANGLYVAGDVGLGIASPLVKLDVAGQIRVDNGATQAPQNSTIGGTGSRFVLWPGSASSTPYAFGIDSSTLWSSVPTGSIFRWYGGTTSRMSLDSAGNLVMTGELRVQGMTQQGVGNGTSQAPNRALITRRLNTTINNAGQVVALGGNGMTLIRDGTAGGFIMRVTQNTNQVLFAKIYARNGGLLASYNKPYYGNPGDFQVCSNAQNASRIELSFGDPINAGDMTDVVLTRFIDASGGNEQYGSWIGTVTSTVNQ